jgi:hypothetical protein
MNNITEIHIFFHITLKVTFTDSGIGIEALTRKASASATVPESAAQSNSLDILV